MVKNKSLFSYFFGNKSSLSSNNKNSNNNLKIYFIDFSEMSNASVKKKHRTFGTIKYLPKISQTNENMQNYDTFAVLVSIHEMIENSLYKFNKFLPDVGLQKKNETDTNPITFSKYLIEYIDINQRKLFSYLILQYIGIPHFLKNLEISKYIIRKKKYGKWTNIEEKNFPPINNSYDKYMKIKDRTTNVLNFTKNKEDNLKNFWELIRNLEELSKLIQVDIMG